MQKTIGIYGGSFNPIHDGHIAMADTAYFNIGLDEVWLMPSPQNPLKLITGMASFEDRYAMCELAAKGRDWLKVTDFEQRNHSNNRSNQTLFTLRALSKENPDCRFVWLMGADNLEQLPQWFGWKQLVQEYAMGIFDRSDQCKDILSTTAGKYLANSLQDDSHHIKQSIGWTILEGHDVGISSTLIRSELSHGINPAGVNPYVLEYIRKHKLYQEASWYVPDIQIDNITSFQAKTGLVPTLYDEKNIYSEFMGNAIEDCDALIKFTGETIRDVVALRPERAALHSLIVELSLNYRIDNYEQLQDKTQALYQAVILPQIHAAQSTFEEIERDAEQIAEGLTRDNTDHVLEQRMAKVASHAEWQSLPPSEQKRIQQILTINTILRSKVDKAVDDLVSNALSDENVRYAYGLRELDTHAPEDRKTFLVAGGPAVGKNRVVQSLARGDLPIPAFDLADVCKINPDFYKEIILSSHGLGPYMPYYGSLTHEESFLISDKIYLAWQRAAQSGLAPNLLADAARPHPWIMDVLESGGGAVHVFVATCDIDRALERNYNRGLETGRFMPTQKLLTFHQSVYPMLMQAINEHQPHVFLLDTNSDAPAVAAIWGPGKNLIVRLPRTLENFSRTNKLNPKAVNDLQLGP